MNAARYFLLLMTMCSSFAYSNIEHISGQCFIESGQIYLSSNNQITLASEPQNALRSGIVFYFIYETELREGDGWFATKHTLRRERILRYDHITRSFIVEDPITLSQRSYNSIELALDALGNIERMPIASIDLLAKDAQPSMTNTLQLDLDKLPVSLRLSTLLDSDWSLSSEAWQCQPSD